MSQCEFQRELRELHSAVTFTVEFSMTPRARIRWLARMSGTDFLDGDWENVKSGSARSHKAAMRAAVEAFER